MRFALLLMPAVLQALCKDQEFCEISPRNPVVPYGSDLAVFLKAPSGSNCRSKTPFNPSKVFWTLNYRKIDERFYDFNSTYASVSIRNVSVEKGTVECFLNAPTPVLLHGTFIWTYPPVSSPQNVSCIGKMNSKISWPTVTCMWDHDQSTTDIKYTVHLKQKNEYSCESQGKNCTFPDNVRALLGSQLNVSVSAQDPYGYSAYSSEVTYREGWAIVQMDSPEDVVAEPLPSGLRVTWKIEQKKWIIPEETQCEIQLREKDSYKVHVKPREIKQCSGAEELTDVKPCTNYSVSVRSRHLNSVWSTWSREVTALSYLNVSSLQFHLWRSKSVLGDGGKRTVHLMWKGIPPSCKALNKYCIVRDSGSLVKCTGPYQNNMFITLDEHPHNITVSAFRNETSLSEASIEVPAMAEEVNLPPVGNISVFVQHEGIQITWVKASLPVSGYIIVWNSTVNNHMWQQTPETSFTLKGEPFTLYTISLAALYKSGPGTEITLHNCSRKRHLTKVSKVRVTEVSDKNAEIHWLPLLPSQCCAFVLNYTVIYNTYNGPKTRIVTVGPNQHSVILKDLQAKTTYSVYIMANTVADSFKSVPVVFLTTSNSQLSYILIIACCLGLILLPLLAVTIQRKICSKTIPDPHLSSLSMWPSDTCKKPWSLFLMPGSKDTEKILPCHVDREDISVSPQGQNDITVKALTDTQNTATCKTSQTENPSMGDSFLNKGQLSLGDKKQRDPHVLSLDFQNSGLCPVPPSQSPYRTQTPLNSPVESPIKPIWSDETEALLTAKPKNTTYFISYVTLDMFELEKHQTK